MIPERPKSLVKRTILKKLSEASVHETMHDMVFGYPPMLEEDMHIKCVCQEKIEAKSRKGNE